MYWQKPVPPAKRAKTKPKAKHTDLSAEDRQVLAESSNIIAQQQEEQRKVISIFGGGIDSRGIFEKRRERLQKDDGTENGSTSSTIEISAGQKRPAAEISIAQVSTAESEVSKTQNLNHESVSSSEATDEFALASGYGSGLSSFRPSSLSLENPLATISAAVYHMDTPMVASIAGHASKGSSVRSTHVSLTNDTNSEFTFLNPVGEVYLGKRLTLDECKIDDKLYDKLKFRTPRAKGHLGKRPSKTSLGVYVTDSNRLENLAPLSIDPHLEIITMLIYMYASKTGYYGDKIEKQHFISISAKLLANESSWEFNGILQPAICQLIFSSVPTLQYMTKWSNLIYSLQSCVRHKLNCIDGGR